MSWQPGTDPDAPPPVLPGVRVEPQDEIKWYYQPKATYWVRADENTKDSDWVSLGPESFKLELIRRGFKDRVADATGLKEWERERLLTEKTRRLDYVGPLAGHRKGPVREGGALALVTKSLSLVEPREGSFETLGATLDGILRGSDEEGSFDQTPYFLAWWRYALQCLYNGMPKNGLCLAIAGEVKSGKTLLKEIVRASFGYLECLPYKWMIGKDNFNQELLECPLWTVDDEGSSTRHEDRLALLANIKQIVAATSLRFRDMHKTAMSLAPFRRLFFCLNIEPDRLMVLPPMDSDIADKMLILKAYKVPMPMPTESQEQRTAFWDRLMEELPCLIHALLRSPLPGFEEGRFGSRFFHHPQIMRELSEVGPEMQLLDFVDRLAARPDTDIDPLWKSTRESDYQPAWTGTVTDLRLLLMNDSSPLSVYEKKEVPKPIWIGRRLEKLAHRFPARFIRKRTARNNFWTILKVDPDLEKSGGMEE